MQKEIEHKYLLNGCPDLALQSPPALIEQGWVLRLRLRKKIGADNRIQYFGCLKFGKGLVRSEFEYEISWFLFYILWPLTRGKRVKKLRYGVLTETPHGLRTWEIDVFLDRTLCLAEIEVPATDEVISLPAWLMTKFVREVTGDAYYNNFSLAK